jgi:hypothetical protein
VQLEVPLLEINQKQSKLVKKEEKVGANPAANITTPKFHVKSIYSDSSSRVPREESSGVENNTHLGDGDRESEKFLLIQQTFGSLDQNGHRGNSHIYYTCKAIF